MFTNPVMSDNGQTYERGAILELVNNHDNSPVNRQLISTENLRSNMQIRGMI